MKGRGTAAALAVGLLLAPVPAGACALELILAVDVSGSIDASEFDLQANGLVILGSWPDPADYYLRNVVRGEGAFLETAESFADYADAIKRKLLREIIPQVAAR